MNWRDQLVQKRDDELVDLRMQNVISDLRRYPKLKLSASRYPITPTFGYVDQHGAQTYEIVEIEPNPRRKDEVRMWKAYGRGVLVVLAVRGGSLTEIYRVVRKNKE